MDAAWDGNEAAGRLTAILCINVLHISPWRAAQNLMSGAGRTLRDGGVLLIYGPFMRGGIHNAPSNAAFDASLRARNPDWGVRDVDDVSALAQASGLMLTETIAMPANNFVLAFERRHQPK